jgi:hypothetical protein
LSEKSTKRLISRILVKYWPIFLILLIGTISLTWFKAEILAGGDQGLPPPADILQRLLYFWDPYNPWLGSYIDFFAPSAPPASLIVPYGIFWTTLESIGLSIPIIDRIWIYLLFTLPGLCMYYLVSVLRIKSDLAKFSSALLYMINPYLVYSLTVSGPGNIGYAFLYFGAPLILALFIEGLCKRNFRYAIYIGFASLFLSATFSNPPKYVLIWIPSLLYVLFVFITSRNRWFVAKFVGLTIVVLTLFNIYWLIELPTSFQASNNGLNSSNTIGYLYLTTPEATVINLFRMMGSAWWNQGGAGSPYYPYAPAYNNPYLIATTLAITVLAFLSIILIRNQKIVFFSVLFVLGLFFAKGPNPPGGEIFLWLYRVIPFFYIFRQPTDLFEVLMVLCISAMFGFFFDYLFRRPAVPKASTTLKRGLLVLLILILVFSSGWPIVTGAIMPGSPRGGHGSLPGFQVNIPNYWNEFKSYATRNLTGGGGRILLIPAIDGVGGFFNWGPHPSDYGGPDPALEMISAPFVSTGTNIGSSDSRAILSILNNCSIIENSSNVQNMLDLLNIKYILYRADLTQGYDKTAAACWQVLLSSNSNFSVVEVWGPLILYEDKLWTSSNFYVATHLIVLNGGLNEMNEGILNGIFVPGKSVVLPLNLGYPEFILNDSAVTNIFFKENNPAEYTVQVNATTPFFLVFSESYDKNWIANIDGQAVPSRYHYLVNGYANGWYMSKTGIYTITIQFAPQNLFYIGSSISVTSLILCVILVFISKPKEKLTGLLSKLFSNLRQPNARREISSTLSKCQW